VTANGGLCPIHHDGCVTSGTAAKGVFHNRISGVEYPRLATHLAKLCRFWHPIFWEAKRSRLCVCPVRHGPADRVLSSHSRKLQW
jgi:hypothetical protein